LYADRWRQGTDVQLILRLLPRSFAPYEALTPSEQTDFQGWVAANFLRKALEIRLTLHQDLKVFVQITESVDGTPVRIGALERKLKTLLSGQPPFRVVERVTEADLKLTGRLESGFSSTVPVLGNCYKAMGELTLSFGDEGAQVRTFAWTDTEETKAFNQNPRQAGKASLQHVSRLLFNNVQRFFEQEYPSP